MDNESHKYIARSHMYHNDRPMFDTIDSDSNFVKAINVHQLNRINWKTNETKNTNNENNNDSNNNDRNIGNDNKVKINEQYRQAVRNRDIQNGKIGALLKEYNNYNGEEMESSYGNEYNYPPEIRIGSVDDENEK